MLRAWGMIWDQARLQTLPAEFNSWIPRSRAGGNSLSINAGPAGNCHQHRQASWETGTRVRPVAPKSQLSSGYGESPEWSETRLESGGTVMSDGGSIPPLSAQQKRKEKHMQHQIRGAGVTFTQADVM